MSQLLTIKEASKFATEYTDKNITPSNITYLVNYGRIDRHIKDGTTLIDKSTLLQYYCNQEKQKENFWKSQLGQDLNWSLSFDYLKEADTTKHVHRLHPYKGKFIPQLVEYFLDDHIDAFKIQTFFQKGDIVLDPFCGSGTTLIQANELGMHAVGVDVSIFNTLMSNVKIQKVNLAELEKNIVEVTSRLKQFVYSNQNLTFESAISEKLNDYNKKFFPSPDFKIKVRKKEIDEQIYYEKHRDKIEAFYIQLIDSFKIQVKQKKSDRFIEKWYLAPVRNEIDFLSVEIQKIQNQDIKQILTLILSRTIRSCRATPHGDLATLIEPVTSPYYCAKHGKICKPLFSLLSWWQRYTKDTVKRFCEFRNLRTDTEQICLHGDGQSIELFSALKKQNDRFSQLAEKNKIKGIFSSPPYVGLIDYHEQHAYAYDLFGFERRDDLEIGPLYKRQNKQAQKEYITGIAKVLINCKRFLQRDYHVFLVANDKFNLYPQIAEMAGMEIVEQYKRPVLNRTEKDRGVYGEIVFWMREKK